MCRLLPATDRTYVCSSSVAPLQLLYTCTNSSRQNPNAHTRGTLGSKYSLCEVHHITLHRNNYAFWTLGGKQYVQEDSVSVLVMRAHMQRIWLLWRANNGVKTGLMLQSVVRVGHGMLQSPHVYMQVCDLVCKGTMWQGSFLSDVIIIFNFSNCQKASLYYQGIVYRLNLSLGQAPSL